jgi:hypothetical protein
VDAKDVFGELNVEQQTAVNTALKTNITVRIKYRDETSEFAVNSGELYIAFAVQKNNHTALQKISVQVDTERAESEVKKYVESENAGSAALAALKTAKTDELYAKEEFEELHVLKQKADDADPELQHLHCHPEQALVRPLR